MQNVALRITVKRASSSDWQESLLLRGAEQQTYQFDVHVRVHRNKFLCNKTN